MTILLLVECTILLSTFTTIASYELYVARKHVNKYCHWSRMKQLQFSTKRRLWDIRNGDATSPTRRAIKSPVRNGQEHNLLGIPRFPAIHLSELRDPLAAEACAIAYNLLWNDVFLSVASMRCQPKTELPLNNSFKKKKTSLRWESVTCRRGSTIRILYVFSITIWTYIVVLVLQTKIEPRAIFGSLDTATIIL